MNAPDPHSTAANLLTEARTHLTDPREATILVAAGLGVTREYLYAHPEYTPTPETAASTLALVARRAAGEPVAYLIGRREFFGLELAVTPDVLIPRPETELTVELALDRLSGSERPRIADLGTGSGAIALAIAHERPDAQVIAIERSAAALAIARTNASRHELHNVRLVRGNWFAPLREGYFDLIASNPPYVADGDPHLAQGDVRHEPRAALTAGPDGLAALHRIITAAAACLRPRGWVVLEHGAEQQQAVIERLTRKGFTEIEGHPDLAGLPRAVTARGPDAR